MKKHLLISGIVQGVGFRHWLYLKATEKNIHGWVKNKTTGEVEALLIGKDKDVEDLIRKCKLGPSMSSVEKITTKNYKSKYPALAEILEGANSIASCLIADSIAAFASEIAP